MTKKKLAYEAPKIEAQELRLEGLVCASKYGSSQAAGMFFSSGNGNIYDYTDGDDF